MCERMFSLVTRAPSDHILARLITCSMLPPTFDTPPPHTLSVHCNDAAAPTHRHLRAQSWQIVWPAMGVVCRDDQAAGAHCSSRCLYVCMLASTRHLAQGGKQLLQAPFPSSDISTLTHNLHTSDLTSKNCIIFRRARQNANPGRRCGGY